ncbi:MAG: hypothetical protein LBD38_05465 [Streptococcaceae bacterium]|jgi:hypothetical protein|nr:hypothetical protein [Streptococcaceae bacterium]
MSSGRIKIYRESCYILEKILSENMMVMRMNGLLPEEVFRLAKLEEIRSIKILEKIVAEENRSYKRDSEEDFIKQGVWYYMANKFFQTVRNVEKEASPCGNRSRIVIHEMNNDMIKNLKEEANLIKLSLISK